MTEYVSDFNPVVSNQSRSTIADRSYVESVLRVVISNPSNEIVWVGRDENIGASWVLCQEHLRRRRDLHRGNERIKDSMSSRRIKRQSDSLSFDTVRESVPVVSMRLAKLDPETNVNFISLRERHLIEAPFAKIPRTTASLSA